MAPRTAAAAAAALALALIVVPGRPAAAQTQITFGQAHQGQLTAADRRLNDGSAFDEYVFFGQSGQTIVVDMISSDFDTYLLLWNQNGQELANDDDSGEGVNAQLTYTLPYTGSYRIIANSYSSGLRTGNYVLSLRLQGAAVALGQPQPITPAANPGTGPMLGMIGANQQVQGNLTAMDSRYDGKPYQAWGFQCAAGQTFQMDILGSGWDNYALVFDPAGSIAARDDDSGGNLNARVSHTCRSAGVYRLIVTTFSSATTPGMYTLQVQSQQMMAAQPAPIPQPIPQPITQPQAQPGVTLPAPVTMGAMPITGRIPDPGQVGRIEIGQNVQGRLETGDQQMNDGTWADVWQFQGRAGQSVTIELRSDEFDTYLQLLDAQGNRLAEDDDSLGDLNSRITFRLPATGSFQIVVNNFSEERRSGVYTLSLR
jgi:hypothetical protein